ncbi:MAG: hypothetical protein KatS3mg114_0922 [Planctomycetaceae bacterium]|jgi:hypothetical protein|nr:MAG: hypothetical protein KatS3mg114_0922 [Planctomycetaceae bacterium]
MKTFTDRQGRSWTIEINYTSLRRVKAATDVDLTRLVDPKSDVMGQLTGDPFILFDCLVALLQPQLDDKGITAEQFGESLDEESADKAAVALIEAAIDFFQEGKRMLLKRAFAKVTTAAQRRQTASLDQAMRAVESPEFEQAIETALDEASRSTSGSSATNSPASLASTPAR